MNYSKNLKLILGPLLAFMLYVSVDLSPGNPMVTKMAAVAVGWATGGSQKLFI